MTYNNLIFQGLIMKSFFVKENISYFTREKEKKEKNYILKKRFISSLIVNWLSIKS